MHLIAGMLGLSAASGLPLQAQTPAAAGGSGAGSMDVQGSDALTRAAAAVTDTLVRRYLDVLTSDSLRARPTPSPALERTAQYVAAEFQRLRLQPGIRGTLVKGQPQSLWIQRYPVPGQQQVDATASYLTFLSHPRGTGGRDVLNEHGWWALQQCAPTLAAVGYFTPEVGPQVVMRKYFDLMTTYDFTALGKPLAVVAGRQTAALVRQQADELRDHVVLYVPAADVTPVVRRAILTELHAASAGVLVVSDADSANFAAEQAAHGQPATLVDGYLKEAMQARRWPWALVVRAGAIQRCLRVADLDLAQLQGATMPVLRPLPEAPSVAFGPAGAPTVDMADVATTRTAPNVVGLLEGSDPALRDEYLILSTHLDTPPSAPGRGVGWADRPAQDKGDNTLGVAGLLAVAAAFSQPGARPRRSVLFLATSGGAHEFWGARYFVANPPKMGEIAKEVALNLTLDAEGRSWGDTIRVDGMQDVKLAVTPDWVAGAHPDLDVSLADGGTVVRPRSDHFAFVQAAVPSLYVHPWEGTDASHAGVAIPAERAAQQTVRVSRLLFYLGQALANAAQSPEWSHEGRRSLDDALRP